MQGFGEWDVYLLSAGNLALFALGSLLVARGLRLVSRTLERAEATDAG